MLSGPSILLQEDFLCTTGFVMSRDLLNTSKADRVTVQFVLRVNDAHATTNHCTALANMTL